MKLSEISLIKNFKSSRSKIIRSYKFRKKNLKIVEIELFGDNDEYIRFSVDVELLKTSELKLASKFIVVATGHKLPQVVTVDEPELIDNLIQDIQEDTNDTQIGIN